jgi:hypothetical protein
VLNQEPKKEKDIALVWHEHLGDSTLENWSSLFGQRNIKHKIDSGLPLENVTAVELFWRQIDQFLRSD